MPSMSQGGRHGKAQALPLPRMARNQRRDSRCFQKMVAKKKNIKEGVGLAKKVLLRIFQMKVNGTGRPFQHEEVGV